MSVRPVDVAQGRPEPVEGRLPPRLVDLHLHTTASDGRCSPRELVDRAASAGVTVMAVTDHDTTAAIEDVRACAALRGMVSIPGIEITAIDEDRDVHVLGYFFEPSHAGLGDFLARQRTARLKRVERIAVRLAELGMPVDLGPLLDDARHETGRSVGRPRVAHAMIAAGYVADVREAFDRWLGRGLPAFVPRAGATTEDVIHVIHAAGGLASLAHPGRTAIDHRIPQLRDAGLDAIEAYHPDHDADAVVRYRNMAADLGLLTTGGSDFHGYPGHGLEPGAAALPSGEWRRLETAGNRDASR